ncbi:hypothetical protein NP233_g10184 [Leucocoprinus birnbaumii]|uniref:RNA cytidine acetyltransferase n=1 Tax=Leucocoprinus birnbaumii TaxID=56174 RepID=A0AAD5YS56_9AGAR|nr:hypothetical protein NP233_g10184 [Leucocoprinus birnbaumii]
MASALAHGYSNIFVTSPSPENLKTLFEFVFKGLDALGYEEHLDYDIVQSVNPEFNKAIVRVNVFRDHRQTIQYIQPEDAHVLGQAELVVIDEAAAIPLPLVKNLLGPYLVFMASTINGYEGTGRSLSLKLIQQLRESTRPSLTKDLSNTKDDDLPTSFKKPSTAKAAPKTRTLREISLTTPIRYSSGDKIETWLNALLCLDATILPKSISSSGCPHPSQCELFYVSRDTLFSYHPASELFLQRMMALYVSSHYKNQPNDLQLLSDAPAHHLFVLLPPLKDDETHLPEPLVVLQVALEGNISKNVIMEGLGRGLRAGGDMIPWLIAQQFQESAFGGLSGARVVRVACHPDYANMGYGSRALEALNSFYSGEYFNLEEEEGKERPEYEQIGVVDPSETLQTETPTIRSAKSMPPLLQRLTERKPENLDYLGVSYGLTPPLLRFWKRAGYVPLYIRQTQSELTDFRKRFLALLAYKFREFGSVTALSVLEGAEFGISKNTDRENEKTQGALTTQELAYLLTPFDIKRLEQYANNQLDYHVVLDLIPVLANLYFQQRLRSTGEEGEDVKLSAVQSAILLAVGLQRKSVEQIEEELGLPVSQALALFVKIVKKITKRLVEIQKESISAGLALPAAPAPAVSTDSGEQSKEGGWKNVSRAMEEELDEAGDEATRALREKQREMIDSLDLRKYAINDNGAVDWSTAEAQISASGGGGGRSTVVSVKMGVEGKKRKAGSEGGIGEDGTGGEGKKSRRSKKVKR